MNDVEIFEQKLIGERGGKYKFAILRCNIKVDTPKSTLNAAVFTYVEHVGYNEFVEVYNDNPWTRIIVSGINELQYIKIYSEDHPDVECFENNLTASNDEIYGRFAIIRGGLDSDKPLEYMNNIVSKYAGDLQYNHYIEIHMDNPWVRLVVFGMDNLVFTPFSNQRLYEGV